LWKVGILILIPALLMWIPSFMGLNFRNPHIVIIRICVWGNRECSCLLLWSQLFFPWHRLFWNGIVFRGFKDMQRSVEEMVIERGVDPYQLTLYCEVVPFMFVCLHSCRHLVVDHSEGHRIVPIFASWWYILYISVPSMVFLCDSKYFSWVFYFFLFYNICDQCYGLIIYLCR